MRHLKLNSAEKASFLPKNSSGMHLIPLLDLMTILPSGLRLTKFLLFSMNLNLLLKLCIYVKAFGIRIFLCIIILNTVCISGKSTNFKFLSLEEVNDVLIEKPTAKNPFLFPANSLARGKAVITLNSYLSKIGVVHEEMYVEGILPTNCPVPGTITWTGNDDADWDNPNNWSPTCVPTINNHAFIPAVSRHPVISNEAVIRSLHVRSGARLEIEANGSLTINGFSTYGIFFISSGFMNQGSITNKGLIRLGSTSSVGNNGLWNEGTFTNAAGGEIIIDRTSDKALLSIGASAVFTNSGKIVIGANHSVGLNGLQNERGRFTNEVGGEIYIDRSSVRGLWNWLEPSLFTNAGKIVIGAQHRVGSDGLINEDGAVFINTAEGDISIDRTSDVGLNNLIATAEFINSGKITMGLVDSIGVDGLRNSGRFINHNGGEIEINWSSLRGLWNWTDSAQFVNAGKIVFGSSHSVGDYGLHNEKGTFTNLSGGEIAIDRTLGRGVLNSGNLINSGRLVLGAVDSIGVYGLYNWYGIFTNASGGVIEINRSSSIGLLNTVPTGSFTNAGKILIGDHHGVGSTGLYNWTGIFTNAQGGEIIINRSTFNGLRNGFATGTFTNAGKISIGTHHRVGQYGVHNADTLVNAQGGEIAVDRSSIQGFRNSGNLTNSGRITIGALDSVGPSGLYNLAAITNEKGGEISINRCSSRGIYNSGASTTFANSGKVVLGAQHGVGRYALENRASFQNDHCGELYQYAPMFNNSNFSNHGIMLVNTGESHSNTSGFVNHGIITYLRSNAIPNVTNREIIILPTAALNCDVIRPAFSFSTPIDLKILGIFMDENATISAGNYNVMTNTLTATAYLGRGTRTLYLAVEDEAGECIRVAPWVVTIQNCCDIPEAKCRQSLTLSLVEEQVSIIPADVNNGSTFDCGLRSMEVSPNTFNCHHVGTPQIVTLTVTDNKNNITSCTITVMVRDNSLPVINCPYDILIEVDDDLCERSVSYHADATDNCEIAAIQYFPSPGSIFGMGETTVSAIAQDVAGNTAQCTFKVELVSTIGDVQVMGSGQEITKGHTAYSPINRTLLGTVDLGGEIEQEYEVVNWSCKTIKFTGVPKVKITGPSAAFFTVEISPSVDQLGPWETTTFQLKYIGSSYGFHEAMVEIETSDGNYVFGVAAATSLTRIQVTGNGTSIPNGRIRPREVDFTDFGVVDYNSQPEREFTIHNLGSDALYLPETPRISLSGPGAGKFEIVTEPDTMIPGGSESTFSVRFDATEIGEFEAWIWIESNDRGNNPYVFAIKATILAPKMSITGNGETIENGSTSPIESNFTDFGVRPIRSNTDHDFYVQNDEGGGLLVLTGNPLVSISGSGARMFSVIDMPEENIRSQHESPFRIRYRPTSAGIHEAVVTIRNNDPSTDPYTFTIRGQAIRALPDEDWERQGPPIGEKETELKVYPNPTRWELYIEAPKAEQSYGLEIIDLHGRLVWSAETDGGLLEYRSETLKSGVYILRTTLKGVSPIRWIKVE